MSVTVNLKVLESMIYFWEAVKGREKMGEQYFVSIAEMPEMKPLYGDDFSQESVRKLLSGISNREMFPWNQKEGRFWNNNMWVLEEYAFMQSVLAKVKVLNLDHLGSKASDLEVIIIPGHVDASYRSEGKLTLNYFKLRLSEDETELTFEGMPLKAFIEGQI